MLFVFFFAQHERSLWWNMGFRLNINFGVYRSASSPNIRSLVRSMVRLSYYQPVLTPRVKAINYTRYTFVKICDMGQTDDTCHMRS